MKDLMNNLDFKKRFVEIMNNIMIDKGMKFC